MNSYYYIMTSLWEKLGIDVKDVNYKMLKPPKTKNDKYIVLSNNMYQMDLMFLPKYKDYEYILCIVNMRTRLCDVFPLKNKKPDTVLKAFKEIQKRNVVENEIKKLIVDGGTEFKGPFQEYCENEHIDMVFTRPGNHKQNAIVESTNGQFKKYLQRYLAYKDLKSGKNDEYFSNWVDVLYLVRDHINEQRKEQYPKHIDLLNLQYHKKKPKFSIGDRVHVRLDAPKDTITESRLHGGFRYGDLYYSRGLYTIIGISDNPGKQLRYKVEAQNGKPVYGSYLENELLAG